jgi:beta-galactosidase/beta-glucuronidase
VQQTLQMDFYNYAGIHRDVVIYVKPVYYIQNVLIKTDFSINESGVPIGYYNLLQ